MAVGARFSDRSVGRFDESEGMNIIHMDIDPAEIGKNKLVDVAGSRRRQSISKGARENAFE